VVIMTRQFATMIIRACAGAGLDILSEQSENPTLKESRAVVYESRAVNTLADALRKHPRRSPS